MLKKTIKYTDYNGVEREEEFLFNLSKAEIMEMQMGTTGGLAEMIQNVIKAQDIPTIIKLFKDIILKAYGEKSADGKRFVKSKELSEAFSQTEAYSNLFMELATNDIEAANFINGIVPVESKMSDAELKKLKENSNLNSISESIPSENNNPTSN